MDFASNSGLFAEWLYEEFGVDEWEIEQVYSAYELDQLYERYVEATGNVY